MADRGIPLFCHEEHMQALSRFPGFLALERAGFLRIYDHQPFLATSGLRVEAIPLSHDGGATFGFRIEGKTVRRGGWLGVGFLADTGRWSETMVEALAGSTVLAVEFNHDVVLQRTSGRSPFLIERVLSDEGHLSNEQAAELVHAVLRRSKRSDVRHIVLLHLSEECNRPELALRAAHKAVRSAGGRAQVVVARQHDASALLQLPQIRSIPAPHISIAPAPRASLPLSPAAS
jgi:phosphoribosyl 1,2-cyclic phosphodiesterase